MGFEGGWKLLLGLYIICTAGVVQGTSSRDVIVHGEERDAVAESGYKLLQG
jgi:hypothetical protein